MPKVSILLSIYKSEKYLEHFLPSVKAQTIWNEAEFIITANDVSTVEKTILDEFYNENKSNTKILYTKRENLYASWNRCINHATGEYFAIANVDDIRTPGSLESQIKLLDQNKNALFCYGDHIVVSKFLSTDGELIKTSNVPKSEFTRSMIIGPFFVWRKTDNPAIAYFDEQFKSGGDFDFAIRLAVHGEGVRVNGILGYYYYGNTGLSTGSELQPIERTFIELRYGIYDKIDYNYLPDAVRYNIPYILENGTWRHISFFVPGYDDLLVQRRREWFSKGVTRYYKRFKEEKGYLNLLKRLIGNIKKKVKTALFRG